MRYIGEETRWTVENLLYEFLQTLAQEEGYIGSQNTLDYLFDQMAGGIEGIEE